MNQIIETATSFLNTHARSAALFLCAFLAGIGYLEIRLFPEAPMMAGTTWTLGLLIICLALSGLPISGGLGVLFIAVWLALGTAGIVYFFKKRKTS
jgi:hypothetical protein